jgi:hypothetical protein
MDRKGTVSMKKMALGFILVTSLAAAAYAATTWQKPAGCDASPQSTLPITAALQAQRCESLPPTTHPLR